VTVRDAYEQLIPVLFGEPGRDALIEQPSGMAGGST
jgi:hypothetical protein